MQDSLLNFLEAKYGLKGQLRDTVAYAAALSTSIEGMFPYLDACTRP